MPFSKEQILSQDPTVTLDQFFENITLANQQWMQQFSGSLASGDTANPFGAWTQMFSNNNPLFTLQNSLYQQQM